MVYPWIMMAIAVLIVALAVVAIPMARAKQEEYKRTGKHPKGHYVGLGMAIGIALGLPLGVAMDNISIGPALGLPIGLALGAAWEKKHEKDLRPLTEKEKKIQRIGIAWAIGLLLLGLVGGVFCYFFC